ncbi:very short patch repair endonuclease [Mycobacterium intracellulare]|uniref:very short patch repair endonuclease n=1 Tax=Mycobacterium intracellulare TaxID=1767 RepID=UPI0018C8B26A
MQSNRSRDTQPEIRVRQLLHASGLRYRVAAKPLRQCRFTADLVFRRARVAVFIDGCFWHGCPLHHRLPTTNRSYWQSKIEINRERDERVDALLHEASWSVLRFWEHEHPETVAHKIRTTLASYGRTSPSDHTFW